ncbi:hypothetical protein NDA01_24305 [Trichocoleus desertorum AS-A10]|uniref:hypothetical protein n=1 Tax=Trichocoleus desertorum TaxID=1481672 RepID=UPI00329797A0
MQFLTLNETNKLLSILLRNEYLQVAESSTRLALLENCNIECSSIDLKKDQKFFIPDLYRFLSKNKVKDGDIEELALIIFLKHILSMNFIFGFADFEEDFITRVIQKWEIQKNSKLIEDRDQIRTSLNRNRALYSASHTSQDNIKLDSGIITDFDLKDIVVQLNKKVNYQGAFAFSVGGNAILLEQYIIKRVKQEICFLTKKQTDYYDIQIYKNSILSSKEIEQKFINKYKIEVLSDLFDCQANTNVLAIIWNHDIPLKQIQPIAEAFWNEISDSLSSILIRQRRCFILIWVNAKHKSLRGFPKLKAPEKFVLSELEAWFYGHFKEKGIEEKQIEDYLTRLKMHDGHLVATYREMDQMIHEISGRLYAL